MKPDNTMAPIQIVQPRFKQFKPSLAKDVPQDLKTKEEVYESAKSQLNLLKTIGMTQMENEFVKKYIYVTKHTAVIVEEIRSGLIQIRKK